MVRGVAVLALCVGLVACTDEPASAVTPVRITPVQDCVLAKQDCRIQVAGKSVLVSVIPKDFLPMQPVEVRVTTDLPIHQAQLQLNGRNMTMPALPYPLVRQPEGHWQGKAMLALCTTKKMDWEALFTVASGNTMYQLPFYFSTVQP